jgi:hypothetical protein
MDRLLQLPDALRILVADHAHKGVIADQAEVGVEHNDVHRAPDQLLEAPEMRPWLPRDVIVSERRWASTCSDSSMMRSL